MSAASIEGRDLPLSILNDHLYAMISEAIDTSDTTTDEPTRTDLDSHANMTVVGRHAIILNTTGRTVSASPFTPDYKPLDVPVVDAAVLYECPFAGTRHILVLFNALHVPSMTHNLIPPFIMREAGITVHDTPKIHVESPSVEDHSLFFPSEQLRIPLSLWGIFSYFPTRKPTVSELHELSDNVLSLTPDGPWNPNSDSYAINEENMLDWEGHVVQPTQRPPFVLADIADDEAMIESITAQLSVCELHPTDHDPMIPSTLEAADISSLFDDQATLAEMNPMLDPSRLASLVNDRCHLGKFAMSIGSTAAFLDDDIANASGAFAATSKGVSPEHLSKIWRIDIPTAKRTIELTTQLAKRSEIDNLSRNYPTNDRMLRYRRVHRLFFMDTFFATSKVQKTTRGHTCMQLFVTDTGFIFVVPMKSKGEVPMAVKAFAKAVGAPDAIVCDAAREQTSQDLRSFCQKIGTTLRVLEKDTQWANRAELYIGLLKEAVRQDMGKTNSPLVLWDYCVERRALINNLTAKSLFQLDGQNPQYTVTGDHGDISNLCQFDWYEWVYYREGSNQFPLMREILGRVLGPAKGSGNEMAQWILKSNGQVVPRRTVRPLTEAECHSEVEARKRQEFDAAIKDRYGDSINLPPVPLPPKDDPEPTDDDDDDDDLRMPQLDDPVDAHGVAIDQQPLYDLLINAEVMLAHQDTIQPAKVIGRSVGPDGKTQGSYNRFHTLNTMSYDVEFPDGTVKEYAGNQIAENILRQIDQEGYTITHLDSIVDYKTDDAAVTEQNAYVTTRGGARRLRKTTCGWHLLVRWTDGSQQWVTLADLKESHPVETAEFAVAHNIHKEPAFAWWVPYTLRKRDVIVSAIKTRTRKTTHKYGIEIPDTIECAYELDRKNGNDFWAKSIRKEMTNVGIAFEILPQGTDPPPGWRKASGHLVFDVKMDLTRKSRWVLDGHLTELPGNISTYAGVVSRESVRIALTYAALNGLDVTAADIRNAYLQAPSSCQDYIVCGLEFGLEHVGKKALIRRALYGGKTAGRDFRNHLRECMGFLGFKTCLADPDVWMRPALKSDGSEYWEYVLLYTDDTLVISENGEKVLREQIGRYFELKEESIGPPDIYLGGRMRKVQLENGANAWAFGSSQYVKAQVQNLEQRLHERGLSLPPTANTPLSAGYRPEVDVSPELDAKGANEFQSLIGVLRWIIELGRVDICCEVSMLSSHLAMPRQGHLNQLYHVFAYLKKYHNAEMVFDPSDPVIDEALFDRHDWTTTPHGADLKEELPPNMPTPRGQGMTIRAYVDADHATDSMTRRSRTGFLVYLNCAPIYWTSKKQASIETSSFGSEFTAMKQCTEYIRGLRYKLRMMGIACDHPAYIYGDNKSVLYNTTLPDSTLKKKSQSLAYHFVREGAARDEWRTAYVNTHLNPADLLTKPLASGEKRTSFVRMVLHHIFGSVE